MMRIQKFAAATGKFTTVKNQSKALGSNLVAVDATDGIIFDCKKYSNDKLMFVFQNTHASTAKDVVLKAPATGGYAKADTDITVSSLAAGAVGVAWVETARYADNTGKIKFTGSSADIKVGAVIIGE
jgi:hypothetical protein